MEPSSICGNSCAECPAKAQLGCPGCRLGPGHYTAKMCEISQCAGSRNIRSCAQCYQHEECAIRAKRKVLPQERSVQQCRVQTAPISSRRTPEQEEICTSLWTLFAAQIVTLAGGSVVAFIMELVSLWNLGTHEKGYRNAFWWSISSLAVAFVLAIPFVVMSNSGQEERALISMLIMLAISSGLELVVKKCVFTAHKKLLNGRDGLLEDTFDSLWKWNLWLNISLCGILGIAALGAEYGAIFLLILWCIPSLIFTVRYIKATFNMALDISTSRQ